MKKCLITGCGKKHDTEGYCGMHYMRIKRHGTPAYRSRRRPLRPDGLKACSKCGVFKIIAEFHKSAKGKDGLASACKVCRSRHHKECYQGDPEKFRVKSRNRYKNMSPEQKKEEIGRTRAHKLKSQFGLTPEAWSSMLASQSGVCDICKTVPTGNKRFSVDHDHKTGVVRGLLCSTCNTALGLLKESIPSAESLIRYISKHT